MEPTKKTIKPEDNKSDTLNDNKGTPGENPRHKMAVENTRKQKAETAKARAVKTEVKKTAMKSGTEQKPKVATATPKETPVKTVPAKPRTSKRTAPKLGSAKKAPGAS